MNDLSKVMKYVLFTICTIGAAIGLYSFSAALFAGLRPKADIPAAEVSPEATYPVRIQYQTVAGNVIKVGAQRIHYASTDSVTRSLGAKQQAHLENVKRLELEIKDTGYWISQLEDELSEARNTAANIYDKTVEETTSNLPKAGMSGKDRFRNMLANSGGYEQADEATSVVVAETIAPLKHNIRNLQEKRQAANNELSRIRVDLPEQLFAALPYSARYITTDEDGRSEMTLSAETRSYCWADFTKILPSGQKERLRWLLLLPDELDANGIIVMSHNNIYTGLEASRLPSNSEENSNIKNR